MPAARLYGLRAAPPYTCTGGSCIPATTAQKAVFKALQVALNTLRNAKGYVDLVKSEENGAIGPTTVQLANQLGAIVDDMPQFEVIADGATASSLAAAAGNLTTIITAYLAPAPGEINMGSEQIVSSAHDFTTPELVGLAAAGAAVLGLGFYLISNHAPAATDALAGVFGLGRSRRRRRR